MFYFYNTSFRFNILYSWSRTKLKRGIFYRPAFETMSMRSFFQKETALIITASPVLELRCVRWRKTGSDSSVRTLSLQAQVCFGKASEWRSDELVKKTAVLRVAGKLLVQKGSICRSENDIFIRLTVFLSPRDTAQCFHIFLLREQLIKVTAVLQNHPNPIGP